MACTATPSCQTAARGRLPIGSSRPTPMRNRAFENRNRFSMVLPPTGIVSPGAVSVGTAAAAYVLLQIGSYPATGPHQNGRAAGRGRGEISGGRPSLKKKK